MQFVCKFCDVMIFGEKNLSDHLKKVHTCNVPLRDYFNNDVKLNDHLYVSKEKAERPPVEKETAFLPRAINVKRKKDDDVTNDENNNMANDENNNFNGGQVRTVKVGRGRPSKTRVTGAVSKPAKLTKLPKPVFFGPKNKRGRKKLGCNPTHENTILAFKHDKVTCSHMALVSTILHFSFFF